MLTETMPFVLITALFGMAIVALFLALLSLVMYFIRGADEALSRRTGDAAAAPKGLGAAGFSGSSDGARRRISAPPLPLWAIAAAAAYLDAEGESARHSATPWTARSGR